MSSVVIVIIVQLAWMRRCVGVAIRGGGNWPGVVIGPGLLLELRLPLMTNKSSNGQYLTNGHHWFESHAPRTSFKCCRHLWVIEPGDPLINDCLDILSCSLATCFPWGAEGSLYGRLPNKQEWAFELLSFTNLSILHNPLQESPKFHIVVRFQHKNPRSSKHCWDQIITRLSLTPYENRKVSHLERCG